MENKKNIIKSTILDKKPAELFIEFLHFYRKVENIKIEETKILVKDIIKYYNGDAEKRNKLRKFLKLENQWYNKLKEGTIDYSIYNNSYYIADLWACWIVYSRQYLKSIKKITSIFNNINFVLDLGCGLGYTSVALKEIF